MYRRGGVLHTSQVTRSISFPGGGGFGFEQDEGGGFPPHNVRLGTQKKGVVQSVVRRLLRRLESVAS